jgi:hypothetical protein
MPRILALASLIAVTQFVLADLTVDGVAEQRWQSAKQINGLVLTQPDSGDAPGFQTKVRYLALPKGIGGAMISTPV